MLPEDLKEAIARGPIESAPREDGQVDLETEFEFTARIAELAYQRGREDERKQRADQEKANLDLAEAIEARGKE